jgi:CRP/FNR family transcriptional regulator, cyclic AMP receptor protein
MTDVENGITPFLRAVAEGSPDGELLVVPDWQRADWEALFSHAERVKAASGDVLIHRNNAERALYFVASGLLEVDTALGSLSPDAMVKIHAGSVVGELSFLDGKPRAAQVRAVVPSELYRMELQDYQGFVDAHPRKACDLVFAIGRVVAVRWRRTLAKVQRQ